MLDLLRFGAGLLLGASNFDTLQYTIVFNLV